MTPSSTQHLLRFHNGTLEWGIDTATGGIVLLRSADGSWSMLDGALSAPFRLLVPLPDRRYNYVEGLDQRPPRCTLLDNGRGVTLEWDSVRSVHGGEHPIAVSATVELHKHRTVFTIRIANDSDLSVENVHYPCLADVQPPGRDAAFFAFGPRGGTAARQMLWPRFENAMGFCSVDSPTYANGGLALGVPSKPFLLLEDGAQGLYWGVDEPSTELVTWHGELRPGWSDSLDSYAPDSPTLADHDVALAFEAAHVPFIAPGETRRLTPIALRHYVGDWHAGADIYVERRRSWTRQSPAAASGPPAAQDRPPAMLKEAAPVPAWARDPHSWQQIQLNTPEDRLRVRFSELPAIARECAERGVTALQVVGWNVGGQDRNNPCHDPDPRLGGWDELKAAIAECQALGVKIILFTKFVWADRATERFRTDLISESVKDPYGDYYVFPGFRYHTLTQLLDINTRRLIPMCFHSERWLAICEQEFTKVLDLGADGMLNDEAFHHAPALLCFDANHGHRPAAPVYAKDREFVHRLRRGPAAHLPDFLYAAEACYDWLFEAYQLSYTRTNKSGHIPLSRYLRPDVPMMTAVTGFDDRNMINQCLLYRYIASYEPFLFKGRLTDFDRTVGYGQRMDALRTELREWFWDGTFRDTVGATVRDLDGRAHHPYAVYESARHGGPALAIANYDRATTINVRAEMAVASDRRYRYRLVDDDTWHDTTPHIVLPPRSAAVVVPA